MSPTSKISDASNKRSSDLGGNPSGQAHHQLIADLAKLGSKRKIRKGSLVVAEGDEDQSLIIILQGQMRVFLTGDSGKELTLGVHAEGEFLGELSLDGSPRSANIEAIEDCTYSQVSAAGVKKFISDQPDFAWLLITKLIKRVRNTTRTSKAVGLLDIYGRMAHLFDYMGVVQDDGSRQLHGRFTQQDLANHIGCSREMVSKLLKDLRQGGYVESAGGRLRQLKAFPAKW